MKRVFAICVLLFVVLIACDNYPQTIPVQTTYNTPTDADSCYLLMWKGTNTNQNQLFEDGNYDNLNFNLLTVYKVPVGTNKIFTYSLPANGETIKLALVPFKVGIPSPLTVSDFYVLPTPPAKGQILNVKIGK